MFDIPFQMLNNYFGSSKHRWVFLISLIILLLYKKCKYRKLIVGFGLIFAMIYFFPPFSNIILKYCIPSNTYWRMIWIVPISIIVCYVWTEVLDSISNIGIRYALLVLCIFSMAKLGYNMYGYDLYHVADNIYKLPQDTIEVCDLLLEDGKKKSTEEICVLAPNELICSIRQYDASIKMSYGRTALSEGYTITECWKNYDACIDQFVPYAVYYKCNYLIWPKATEKYEKLLNMGLKKVGESTNYYVLSLELD